MKKISVVVPVFNAEKYLCRCIDSILAQKYGNLEIILVDDGSTDNSGKICEEYAVKDKRVKVIHKQNGGQSSARNIGIDNAEGKYIGFVDSDDWISPDMYEHMIKIIEETYSDIADIRYVLTDNLRCNVKDDNSIRTIEGKEILRDYLIEGMRISSYSMCRRLYKLSLLKDIRLPEGKTHEEIAFNYKVLINARKIVRSNRVCYFYFQDNSSTTRGGLSKKDFSLIENSIELCKLTENETYKNIRFLAQSKLARSYFSLLAKIAYYGFDDDSLDKNQVITDLTINLRRNYWMLIKAPMPISRKLMATALALNINLLAIPLKIYKKVK